ncbi:hypothetical protein SAMN05660489_06409 [Pseudomonas sp. LAMO17WK12:I10]|nr:hypothetical protein H160_06431 [Pseudomonas sp. LAMO17WK12:I9]SNY54574.1 hypothetical protein SAMN05660489_06409 [Pseudomonas sp. LAMO17WK12:I10]
MKQNGSHPFDSSVPWQFVSIEIRQIKITVTIICGFYYTQELPSYASFNSCIKCTFEVNFTAKRNWNALPA